MADKHHDWRRGDRDEPPSYGDFRTSRARGRLAPAAALPMLRPGDKVKLAPDGLPMLVLSANDSTVQVEWESGGVRARGTFERSRLMLA